MLSILYKKTKQTKLPSLPLAWNTRFSMDSHPLGDDDFKFCCGVIHLSFFKNKYLVCVVLFVPQLLSYPLLARDIRKGPRNFISCPFQHTHDTALSSLFSIFTRLLNNNKLCISFFCARLFSFQFFRLRIDRFLFHPPLFVCSSVFSSTVSLSPEELGEEVYIGICFW